MACRTALTKDFLHEGFRVTLTVVPAFDEMLFVSYRHGKTSLFVVLSFFGPGPNKQKRKENIYCQILSFIVKSTIPLEPTCSAADPSWIDAHRSGPTMDPRGPLQTHVDLRTPPRTYHVSARTTADLPCIRTDHRGQTMGPRGPPRTHHGSTRTPRISW